MMIPVAAVGGVDRDLYTIRPAAPARKHNRGLAPDPMAGGDASAKPTAAGLSLSAARVT